MHKIGLTFLIFHCSCKTLMRYHRSLISRFFSADSTSLTFCVFSLFRSDSLAREDLSWDTSSWTRLAMLLDFCLCWLEKLVCGECTCLPNRAFRASMEECKASNSTPVNLSALWLNYLNKISKSWERKIILRCIYEFQRND